MVTQKEVDQAYEKLIKLERLVKNAKNLHDMNQAITLANQASRSYFMLFGKLIGL